MEPKFKVGDRVKLLTGTYSGGVTEIKEVRKNTIGTTCVIEIGGISRYYRESDFELAEMEAKFKVGDKVRSSYQPDKIGTITDVRNIGAYYDCYTYDVEFDNTNVLVELTYHSLELANEENPQGYSPSHCRHHWVSYVGFSETFEYCKHCDTKR